ncbi:mechanosensitive ion channel [Flavobacteriaceae bacterium]|nr:mechanosensitive ion channel [Flavobacteriaceae bacterium]MDA9015310.1 mechanosensitive ion channel [Flavobacteriaceae bacterium]MDC3354076.1 mechanosensitive ion channel [Flavobacteriaceae bacterium]
MKLINKFIDLINYEFTIGSATFTPKTILIVILVFLLTTFLLKILRKIIFRTLAKDTRVKFKSIFSFINYFIYIVVILIILQNVGVDVTAIFAASAALLVGVGLALQTFIQDIISGIFILIDKSVLVGDIIEVEGQIGQVENIKLRTTRAVTRENKVLIIPNHKFLTSMLFNWTENGIITKEIIEVGVAYKSSPRKIESILLEIANSHDKVLSNPAPSVLFDNFGDSALMFQLYISLDSSFAANLVKSDLRFSIFEAFEKEGVEIPFPQRTVTFTNSPTS